MFIAARSSQDLACRATRATARIRYVVRADEPDAQATPHSRGLRTHGPPF
jgi:hypothetical protein